MIITKIHVGEKNERALLESSVSYLLKDEIIICKYITEQGIKYVQVYWEVAEND